MKKLNLAAIFLAAIIAVLFVFNVAQAYVYPQIQTRVNDYANILSPSVKASLEAKLEQYDNETSNEIVVAIVSSMEGIDIDTYRFELFNEWRLGKEKNDNGILLVISIEEKKVGIEVGYGLEGALTDSIAGSIIRDEITPSFKEGNYDQGVTKGVDAIIAATKGEYVSAASSSSGGDGWIALGVFGGIIGLFIVIGVLASKASKGKKTSRYWDSKNKKWVDRDKNNSWWSSGSSSGGGFSSGGGGFSGGGGSSGGGGASGGW